MAHRFWLYAWFAVVVAWLFVFSMWVYQAISLAFAPVIDRNLDDMFYWLFWVLGLNVAQIIANVGVQATNPDNA